MCDPPPKSSTGRITKVEQGAVLLEYVGEEFWYFRTSSNTNETGVHTRINQPILTFNRFLRLCLQVYTLEGLSCLRKRRTQIGW